MAIKTRRVARHEPDSYLNWVRQLPLKPLKNDDDHARAVQVIGELMGRDLDIGAGDYLDTLR